MSSQVVNPEIGQDSIPPDCSPRLRRKLVKDLAARGKKVGGKRIGAGAKPQWAKNLTRNSAAIVLKQKNAQELWSQLLDAPDLKLRFEVLRYLTDRLEGRPFVAENPNVVKQVNPIMQDQRLQIAVQQLNIMQPRTKASTKRSKSNVINAPQVRPVLAGDVQDAAAAPQEHE